MKEVTQILSDLAQGDAHAAEQLLPLVYEELRKLAAARMVEEAPGNTRRNRCKHDSESHPENLDPHGQQ